MVICLSDRLVAADIFLLLSLVMNLLAAYSFSSSFSWSLVYGIRFFLPRRKGEPSCWCATTSVKKRQTKREDRAAGSVCERQKKRLGHVSILYICLFLSECELHLFFNRSFPKSGFSFYATRKAATVCCELIGHPFCHSDMQHGGCLLSASSSNMRPS